MRRALLVGLAALGAAHVVVALPAAWVRLLDGSGAEPFPGVRSFRRVRPELWRGAAPTRAGYRELAAAGVDTVVDLRAESDAWQGQQAAAAAGLHVVPVPVRDGQTPTAAQLDLITGLLAGSRVFVHCGAGVGRTGCVIAALEVATGANPAGELRTALAFGPLSLEQQVFVLTLPSLPSRPFWLPAVACSRVVDSPRRLFSRLRQLPWVRAGSGTSA